MITLILPAYNEEPAVAGTVETARQVFEGAGIDPFEVIVVDDASSDRTAEVAEAAGARVIRHVQNFGYGRSLKDGIEAARFDTIVISDADGTYPLDAIPTLLTEYQRGFDMTVGARTGEHYRESFIKAPLRQLLKMLVQFAAGQLIPDTNSGLRIFSKATVLPYFPHLCDTFSFTTSLTLAFLMTGRSVSHLPIDYHPRVGETKVRLFRDARRTLHYIVQAILYYDPIKIFLLMCAFALLLGAFCVVIGMVFQIRSAFLLAVGSILVSILIFCLGLLAEVLTKIMKKE